MTAAPQTKSTRAEENANTYESHDFHINLAANESDLMNGIRNKITRLLTDPYLVLSLLLLYDPLKSLLSGVFKISFVGSHVVLNAAQLLLLIFLAKSKPDSVLKIIKNPFNHLVLVGLTYLFLQTFHAENTAYGFDKVATFLARGFFPSIIVQLAVCHNRFQESRHSVLFFGLVACAFFLAFGTYEFFKRRSFPGFNPIWTCQIFSIFIALSFVKVRKSKLTLLGIPILLYCAVLTQSRGPLISLLFGMIVAASYYLFQSRKRIVLIGIPALMLSLVTVLIMIVSQQLFPEQIRAIVGNRLYSLFDIAVLINDRNFVERLSFWTECLRIWWENPIFGVGFGSFSVGYSFGIYPHNLILELLLEAGLAGTCLWLTVIFWNARSIILNHGLLPCVTALTFTLFSGDFGHNYYYFILISFFGTINRYIGKPQS